MLSDAQDGWPRLSLRTVHQACDAVVPSFDRPATAPIVHLGVGAFARAHLGLYADDLLRAGWPAVIRGISLRRPDAEERLAPQDGLYTVAERGPEGEAGLRVVGALTSVRTGPAHAVEAIAAPQTRLVTLTVTEKGYELDQRDLEKPDSAPAVMAQGLARRRRTGDLPLVVAPLDNLSHNGVVLRTAVLEAAARLDPSLPSWIENEVRFASSVVDRIVPASTPAEARDISGRLGLDDLAAVTAEPHRSWVISDVPGLPPLSDVGVEVVADVAPYERRKLWLLNGPHSAFAYCGQLAGCSTIAGAATHHEVSAFVRRLVKDTLDVVGLPVAMDPAGFAKQAMQRFGNPALGHTCIQVGADGSQKLPQRLLPVVAARRTRGLDTRRFATVVAAWLAAVAGVRVQGRVFPLLEDPAAEELRRALGNEGPQGLVVAALSQLCDRRFLTEVGEALDQWTRNGVSILRDSV